MATLVNTPSQFTYNWPFAGNQAIVEFLQRSISNRRLAHFYIFAGAKNLGKSTLANYFASSLLCSNLAKQQGVLPCGKCSHCRQFKAGIHSDIIIIKKQKNKKNISIEQIREFINRLHLSSFGSFYKIGIIKEAEELSIEAANALLKVLEEPKERVIIILSTSQLEELPLTIISRSQVLFFQPTSLDIIYDYLLNKHKVSRDLAKSLSRLSAGKPVLAVKFLQDKNFLEEYKEIITAFIKIIQGSINERFRVIEQLLLKEEEREVIVKAHQILEIWQIVLRDLLFLNFSLDELIVNNIMEKELRRINLEVEELVKINSKIEESKKYLKANVNPKLVLEELSISIS